MLGLNALHVLARVDGVPHDRRNICRNSYAWHTPGALVHARVWRDEAAGFGLQSGGAAVLAGVRDARVSSMSVVWCCCFRVGCCCCCCCAVGCPLAVALWSGVAVGVSGNKQAGSARGQARRMEVHGAQASKWGEEDAAGCAAACRGLAACMFCGRFVFPPAAAVQVPRVPT